MSELKSTLIWCFIKTALTQVAKQRLHLESHKYQWFHQRYFLFLQKAPSALLSE